MDYFHCYNTGTGAQTTQRRGGSPCLLWGREKAGMVVPRSTSGVDGVESWVYGRWRMLRRCMSFVPLVVTILQGCQADNSEQIIALQQQVTTLNSQINETGSQLKETDNQLKETRLQVTGLQTANQELDRALKDLADEISPFTGSDIIPSFESDGKGEIQVVSAAKPREEKKPPVTPAVARSDDEAPVLAAAPAAASDGVASALAAAPAPRLSNEVPVLAAASATSADNTPVLSAAISIARSSDTGQLRAALAAKSPKTDDPILVASATPPDENNMKQAAPAAKPRKKAKAVVRLARRSTGEVSCGKVWKLLDQGRSEAATSEELSATLAVVRDCKQEMLRVRKDKDSDQLHTKS